MSAASGLYRGFVTHRRVVEPAHGFRYPLYMLLLDLDELEELDRKLWLFGNERRRPVGFRAGDHLDGKTPLREGLRALFDAEGVAWPGGPVRLLTHCRVWGHVFNPVSFFYCFDATEALAAVVAQVDNTFGDRHPYVLPVEDGRTAWRRKKLMHVSPFFSLAGSYHFELPAPGERLEAIIDLTRDDRTELAARLSLRREPLDDRTLARALVRYPLVTLKVVAAIHYQALRLWAKGAPFWSQPRYDPPVRPAAGGARPKAARGEPS